MTRYEMIEHMSMTFVGDDVWLLIDEPARERRRVRMAAALDVIDPLIRADERAKAAKIAYDVCNRARGEEWGSDLRSLRGVVMQSVLEGGFKENDE